MKLPTQLFFYRYFEISSEWNWNIHILLLSFRISCDRILRFKDAINKCDVKFTFKLKQIDALKWFGNILSYQMEYKALTSFMKYSAGQSSWTARGSTEQRNNWGWPAKFYCKIF
jgi:hypothetical protein